jgi:hypothetical protein
MSITKERRDELRHMLADWGTNADPFDYVGDRVKESLIPLLDALNAAEADRDRLRAALEDIADPVGYLRRYAEAQGGQFNGGMVQHIVTPYFLSEMARKALDLGHD